MFNTRSSGLSAFAKPVVRCDDAVIHNKQSIAGQQLVVGIGYAAAGDRRPIDGQNLVRAKTLRAARATHIVLLDTRAKPSSRPIASKTVSFPVIGNRWTFSPLPAPATIT